MSLFFFLFHTAVITSPIPRSPPQNPPHPHRHPTPTPAGVLAFIPLLVALFTTFASRAAAKGAAVQAAYSTLSSIFVVAWLFWIAIWATSDGGNHMTPDQSTICYTVFDIIVKSVFGVVLVTSAAALEGAAGVGAKAE